MPINNALLTLYDMERTELVRPSRTDQGVVRVHYCDVPNERLAALRPALGSAWNGATGAFAEKVTSVREQASYGGSNRTTLVISTLEPRATQRVT